MHSALDPRVFSNPWDITELQILALLVGAMLLLVGLIAWRLFRAG